MEHVSLFLENINSSTAIGFTVIRTMLTYIYAVFLIRLGSNRFQMQTPMDYVFVIIIGAVLGRTIYGGASLFSTFVASMILVLMHWCFAYLSYKNRTIGYIFKGKPDLLIQDGELKWKYMKKNLITEEDLREECHVQLNHRDLTKIKAAYIERNGKISFITNKD